MAILDVRGEERCCAAGPRLEEGFVGVGVAIIYRSISHVKFCNLVDLVQYKGIDIWY